jgi:hypothetical protein
MDDNVIRSFQQRRQLTQAIDDLATSANEPELLARVRAIVHTYPSDLVTALLIKNLETQNSQIRGGLGHLANLLPPEEIGPALRAAAANRANSPQTRATAALILERFLGEALPNGLLADLTQTNEVAYQSLREAVAEGALNRHVLLEYVTQMRQTNESVAFLVLDLLGRLDMSDRVPLLRLIAQDDRPAVARTALQQLEWLAADGGDALAALYTLQWMLPPEAAGQAERSLRKIQFSGRRYALPTAEGWRALLSPADVAGNYTVWFVRGVRQRADGVILGFVLNQRIGIRQVFGTESLPPEQIPTEQPIGQLVTVRTDAGVNAALLEAPFDFGRYRLAAAQAIHWAQPAPQPLPGEYRLYGDRLWTFAPPVVDPELARRVDDREPPSPLPSADTLDQSAAELLAHPAMQGWSFHNRTFMQAAGLSTAARSRQPLHELTRGILAELERSPERDNLTAALTEGLLAQAAWLHIAGSRVAAQHAHLLARCLAAVPFAGNPFLARLVETGLRRSRASNTNLI